MFVPSEETANGAIAALTGIPTTLFALSLSQTDVALIAIVVNVCLAVGLKIVDVYARQIFDRRERARIAREAREAEQGGPNVG